uniref:Putative serine hydrolase n=1 Tax=Aceria tosichella TaxID=561515 RepID=A0A6G1SB39_9ACAR
MRKLPRLYSSRKTVSLGIRQNDSKAKFWNLSRHYYQQQQEEKEPYNRTIVRKHSTTTTTSGTLEIRDYFLVNARAILHSIDLTREQPLLSKRVSSIWRDRIHRRHWWLASWEDISEYLLKLGLTLNHIQAHHTLPHYYCNIASSNLNKCCLAVTRSLINNNFSGSSFGALGRNLIRRESPVVGKRSLAILDFKRSKITTTTTPITVDHNTLASQMSSNARKQEETMEDRGVKYEPREISFKTPYGHVACLEWGQREAPNKIFCIHGWLDNAGSFEPLVPYILKHQNNYSKYHIVAMDMPGVGHSSHKPPGSEYTTFSHIIEMRRITQQLGWHQNLTLLAHSMGGHLSFIYSCIYPKQVSSVISIDTTHPLTHQAANWHVTIGNSIEHYFKCEYYGHKNEKLDTVMPVYTEADAIKRLMDAHSNSLTLESAKVMFKRGATKHPNGSCTFNRDVRHRHLSVEFRPDDELMLKFLEHTFKPSCLFIIRALRSPYHRPDEIRLKYYSLFERNCRLFRDIMLDGTHHLHMNSPDLVAVEINKFLEDAELVRSKASEDCNGAGSPQKGPLIDKPNL